MDIGLFILLGFLIGFIAIAVGLCACFEGSDKISFISLIVMILGFALPIYCSCKLSSAPLERPSEPYVTQHIMCLADNTMMSGRIYLRSGYISEDHHYLYGYRTVTGGMKTQKVKASAATVYFSDSVTPRAEWYKDTQRFWFFKQTITTCDIYIPVGSLVEDYRIDLQ